MGLPQAEEAIKDGEEVSGVPKAVLVTTVALGPKGAMRSGNLPWHMTVEESFREVKRLVVGAIDLFVPDLEGAPDGSNPMYMWPDACGWSVGAGLFQHGPRPKVEELLAYAADAERLSKAAVRRGAEGQQLAATTQALKKSLKLRGTVPANRRREGACDQLGRLAPELSPTPHGQTESDGGTAITPTTQGSGEPRTAMTALFSEDMGTSVSTMAGTQKGRSGCCRHARTPT